MNLTLNTNIGGYFTYRIYRETPDKIVYKSPERKNLIVDTGLEFLYDKSINDVIRVLDLGVSNQQVRETDTGIVGERFPSSSYFTNLSALSLSASADYNTNTSHHTAFFRTRTTPRSLRLREFSIKPEGSSDAFCRQLLDIDLEPGDGIEFTYEVRVEWPCGIQEFNMPLTYRVGLSGEEYGVVQKQTFDDWTYSTQSTNIEDWVSIAVGGTTYIAVASSNNSGSGENIIYSTNGKEWQDATIVKSTPPYTESSAGASLNDVTFGNNTLRGISQFVAVGSGAVAISNDNLNTWLLVDPVKSYNWTGVTFGYSSKSSFTGRYLAVSNTGDNRVMHSQTGTDWITGGDDITNSIGWSSVAYGPVSGFVAVADSGSHRIAYSSTGTSWASAEATQHNSWSDIVYGNGVYVAVSKDGSLRSMYANESDLSTWTAVATPEQNSWNSVAYGNGVFAAVAPDGDSRIIYTRDLVEWTAVDTLSSLQWSGISYDGTNRRFVAVAKSGSIYSAYSIFIDTPVYPSTTVPVSASITQIPIDGRVTMDDSHYMYTVKSIELSGCVENTTYNSLDYSTENETNSYSKASSSFTYPNSAINSFSFGPLSGYGPIKGLMVTKGRTESTPISTTRLGLEWYMPAALQPDNNETISSLSGSSQLIQGEAGSLDKPILQSNNINDLLKLDINIISKWGSDRSGAVKRVASSDNDSSTGSISIAIGKSQWKLFQPVSTIEPLLLPTTIDSQDPNSELKIKLVSNIPLSVSNSDSLTDVASITIGSAEKTGLIDFNTAESTWSFATSADIVNTSYTSSEIERLLQESIARTTGILNEVSNVEFTDRLIIITLNNNITIDRALINTYDHNTYNTTLDSLPVETFFSFEKLFN